MQTEEERGGSPASLTPPARRGPGQLPGTGETGRNATEYILLGLGKSLDLPDRVLVEMTARVTDEVSGQTVSRSVALTLVSEDSS